MALVGVLDHFRETPARQEFLAILEAYSQPVARVQDEATAGTY